MVLDPKRNPTLRDIKMGKVDGKFDNDIVDLALEAKEKNEERTIVFCLSGHGLLDLYGYEQYLDGTLPSSEKQ